ncbi:hypothetical protein BH11ARM1_BH11ARM1_01280 [soil metagenome]
MIEIRPITAIESETFLALLCKVFDLDTSRARSVFYSEPFYDLKHKWALFDSGRMVSILTTTPLTFGWGNAIGVAGVATLESEQGQGYASLLLSVAAPDAVPSLLFARDPRVYLQQGFAVVDEVVRGALVTEDSLDERAPLAFEPVRDRYEAWASEDVNRLQRDKLRWEYWKWNYRTCESCDDGYLAIESTAIREIVASSVPSVLPLFGGTDWFGLRSMTEAMQIPVISPERDLYLMTRGLPAPPQMFMTDQF